MQSELIHIVRWHVYALRSGNKRNIRESGNELDRWLRAWDEQEEVRGAAPSFRKPQTSQTGLAAIIGKWPGDETDEQIDEALDERPATP
jgi:hypothetical protein